MRILKIEDLDHSGSDGSGGDDSMILEGSDDNDDDDDVNGNDDGSGSDGDGGDDMEIDDDNDDGSGSDGDNSDSDGSGGSDSDSDETESEEEYVEDESTVDLSTVPIPYYTIPIESGTGIPLDSPQSAPPLVFKTLFWKFGVVIAANKNAPSHGACRRGERCGSAGIFRSLW